MPLTTDNLDLPYQQRLELYQTNTGAAQAEIIRGKQVYDQEKSNGASAERLNQISAWVGQVRTSAGIDNSDVVYGNNSSVTYEQQKALTELYNKGNTYTPSGNLSGNYGTPTPSDTNAPGGYGSANSGYSGTARPAGQFQTPDSNNGFGFSSLPKEDIASLGLIGGVLFFIIWMFK